MKKLAILLLVLTLMMPVALAKDFTIDSSTFNNIFVVNGTTGKVAVNTINPVAGLQVGAGSVDYATGQNDVYIAGNLEVDGSTFLGDEIAVDNVTVQGTLNVTGALIFNGALDMGGNRIYNIGSGNSFFTTTGGLQLFDSLNVTGTINTTDRIYSMGTDILYNISQLTALELSDNLTQANLINQLRTDLIANSTFQQLLNNSNYTQAQLINQLRADLIDNSTLQQLLVLSNLTQSNLINQLRTDLIANSTFQQLLNDSNLTQSNLINQLRSDLIDNSTLQQLLLVSNTTQANLINQLRLDLMANSSLQQLLLVSNTTQANLINQLRLDLIANSTKLELLDQREASDNLTQANDIAHLFNAIASDMFNLSLGATNYIYSTNNWLGNNTFYNTDSANLNVNGSMELKNVFGVTNILLNGTNGKIIAAGTDVLANLTLLQQLIDSVNNTLDNDHYTKSEAGDNFVNRTGDFMIGDLSMGDNAINNVSDPLDPQDVATKNYTDSIVGALSQDKITEGDSSVEVIDTGNGIVNITIDNEVVMTIGQDGVSITNNLVLNGTNITGEGMGSFVGKTAGTYTASLTSGSLTGYTAGNAICDSEYPNSHMCSFGEIAYTIATKNLTLISEWTGDAWIISGPAKYSPAQLPVSDCNGFKHGASNSYLGNWWNFDNTHGGVGMTGHCANLIALACCKINE